jgi:ketosteroid isomerase-like protein
MSVDSNQLLINNYYAALASGDPDMARFFSEDVEWHLPRSSPMHGTLKGRDAVLGLFGGGSVSDYYKPETMQFEYHATIVANDDVIMPFTMRAVTANGHDYENDYLMRFRIDGGVIAEVWEYFDTATLFELIKPD